MVGAYIEVANCNNKLRNVYSGDPTSMVRSLCFVLVEQQLKTMATHPRFKVLQLKILMKYWHQCLRDFYKLLITVISEFYSFTSFTSLSGIFPHGNSGYGELSAKEGFAQSTSTRIVLISLC